MFGNDASRDSLSSQSQPCSSDPREGPAGTGPVSSHHVNMMSPNERDGHGARSLNTKLHKAVNSPDEIRLDRFAGPCGRAKGHAGLEGVGQRIKANRAPPRMTGCRLRIIRLTP